MIGGSFAQSDVQGPEGPAAVDCVPGEGGERLIRVQEDRGYPQQLGKAKFPLGTDLGSASPPPILTLTTSVGNAPYTVR